LVTRRLAQLQGSKILFCQTSAKEIEWILVMARKGLAGDRFRPQHEVHGSSQLLNSASHRIIW